MYPSTEVLDRGFFLYLLFVACSNDLYERVCISFHLLYIVHMDYEKQEHNVILSILLGKRLV